VNEAHEEIRRVMYRYTRGMDRRDWDLVRSCFHDGAHDDHGTYAGDAEGFIQSAIPRHEKVEMSMHFLGNMLIELDGDRAAVETYCIAQQRYTADAAPELVRVFGEGAALADGPDRDQPVHMTIWCRYLDEFEWRAGTGWRIARRVVAYDSLACTQRAEGVPAGGQWTTGIRTPADPSYALFDGLARHRLRA
jgi:hypothetical protein